MIDNPVEYQKMQDVEQKLWWYRILHERVLEHIQRHIKKERAQVKILDAACGTGGLLQTLKQVGFTHACGFDLSTTAVELARNTGLEVSQGDLRQVDTFRSDHSFDVVCCNDALYFLTDEEIVAFLKNMKARLNPGGILLINIHAFEVFSGTHDLAVGSTRRFTWKDFVCYTDRAGLLLEYRTYWPFLLSLPILLVRQWQKYQIRNQRLSAETVASDVSYPGDIINASLLSVMRLENLLIRQSPFGSSLFMVLR